MDDRPDNMASLVGGALYGAVLGGLFTLVVMAFDAGPAVQIGPVDTPRLLAAFLLVAFAAAGLRLIVQVVDTEREVARAVGVASASLVVLVAAARLAVVPGADPSLGSVALDVVASVVLGGVLIVAAVDVVLRRRDDARDRSLRERRADLVMFNVGRAGQLVRDHVDAWADRSVLAFAVPGQGLRVNDPESPDRSVTNLTEMLTGLREVFGEPHEDDPSPPDDWPTHGPAKSVIETMLPDEVVREAMQYLHSARDIVSADSVLVSTVPVLDDLAHQLEQAQRLVQQVALVLDGVYVVRAVQMAAEVRAKAMGEAVTRGDQAVDAVMAWPDGTDLESRLRDALNETNEGGAGAVPHRDWSQT